MKRGIWGLIIILICSIVFAVPDQYHPALEVAPGTFNEGSGGIFKFISNITSDYYKMYVGRDGYEQANLPNAFDVKMDNATASCEVDITPVEFWHNCSGPDPDNVSNTITLYGGAYFGNLYDKDIDIIKIINLSNYTKTGYNIEGKTGILDDIKTETTKIQNIHAILEVFVYDVIKGTRGFGYNPNNGYTGSWENLENGDGYKNMYNGFDAGGNPIHEVEVGEGSESSSIFMNKDHISFHTPTGDFNLNGDNFWSVGPKTGGGYNNSISMDPKTGTTVIDTPTGRLTINTDNKWEVWSGSPPVIGSPAASFSLTSGASGGEIKSQVYDPTGLTQLGSAQLTTDINGGKQNLVIANAAGVNVINYADYVDPNANAAVNQILGNNLGNNVFVLNQGGDANNNGFSIAATKTSAGTTVVNFATAVDPTSTYGTLTSTISSATAAQVVDTKAATAAGGSTSLQTNANNGNIRSSKTQGSDSFGGTGGETYYDAANNRIAVQTNNYVDSNGDGQMVFTTYSTSLGPAEKTGEIQFGSEALGNGKFKVLVYKAGNPNPAGEIFIDPPGDIFINASGSLKVNATVSTDFDTPEIIIYNAPQGMHSMPTNGSAPFLSPKEIAYAGFGPALGAGHAISWVCDPSVPGIINCTSYIGVMPGLTSVTAETRFIAAGVTTQAPTANCLVITAGTYSVCVGK